MCRPRIRGNLVFSPARVAAGLVIHFEQNEIREPFLLEPPRSTQTGNSAPDNNNRGFQNLFRRRKTRVIAQLMAQLKRVVYKRAGYWRITFERQTD